MLSTKKNPATWAERIQIPLPRYASVLQIYICIGQKSAELSLRDSLMPSLYNITYFLAYIIQTGKQKKIHIISKASLAHILAIEKSLHIFPEIFFLNFIIKLVANRHKTFLSRNGHEVRFSLICSTRKK